MAYPVLFYRAWTSIDLEPSSTAAIGLLFVPFVAAVEAVPWAGVGYAVSLAKERISRGDYRPC